MPAPATNDDFLDVVRKSNQVDTDRLHAYIDQHREGDTLPPDPKKLAALLVREGLLTTFQAEQFLKGRWRGFNLGGYRILERVGAGGSGTVFLGEHEVMKRRVAVKILPPSVASEPAILERFRREAQAAAALDHPNIVRAYDFRQEGSTHFLVMEYVNGPSLEQVVASEGPLSVPVACEYIRQAAIGLQHAHEQNVIHRDIKPGNLLVDPSGIVKILDMGLARFAPEGQDSLTRQFDDNTVMGTADYLSPEQALNLHNVDARADIYSLGATLYAMLVGEAPFASGTVTQKLLWHQMRDPTPVDQRRNDVPAEVADIVAGMMAKDISQRFQSAAEVAEALEPFCSTTPTPQGPARPGATTGSGSASYVKSNGTSAGSSVRLTSSNSGRRKAAEPPPQGAVSPRRREDRYDDRDDDYDRPRRRRDVDVSMPPVDSSGMASMLILGGIMGGILLVVAGVVAFLVFGTPPAVTSQTAGDGSASRPNDRSKAVAKMAVEKREEPIVLTGDMLGLERVSFAPDARTLFTGGRDRLIRVWDLENQRLASDIKGHAGEVYFVRFAPSGTKLLSSSADGTARLWAYPGGTEFKRFDVEKGKLWCAIFGRNENEILTAGDDGVVRLRHADSGKVIHEMKGHVGAITSLVLRTNPNHQVISAGNDKTIRIWDLNTGKEAGKLEGHTGPVSSVAGTPNGEILVSGSHDKSVRLWHVNTAKNFLTFHQHQDEVWAVAVAPDGQLAASAGKDKRIVLYDLHKRAFVTAIGAHTDSITGLAFSPDAKSVASCSLDRTARVTQVTPAQ